MPIHTVQYYFTSFSGNYVLNYLATRPKLVHYVTQALVQVVIGFTVHIKLKLAMQSYIVLNARLLISKCETKCSTISSWFVLLELLMLMQSLDNNFFLIKYFNKP